MVVSGGVGVNLGFGVGVLADRKAYREAVAVFLVAHHVYGPLVHGDKGFHQRQADTVSYGVEMAVIAFIKALEQFGDGASGHEPAAVGAGNLHGVVVAEVHRKTHRAPGRSIFDGV